MPPRLIGTYGRGPRRGSPTRIMCTRITGTGSKSGTGETLNNGTHEVDVCRWALGVDYPKRVTSSGGRYHFKDDWQFYDTLVTSFEYEDKLISWEGKSCQGMKYYNRDRGWTIMGTKGTVLVDRGGYEIYDLKGNMTSEFKSWAAPHLPTRRARFHDDATSQTSLRQFAKARSSHAPIELATSPLPCCSSPTSPGRSIGSCNSTPTMAASRATRKPRSVGT